METNAAELAEDLIKITVVDASGESRNVEVISGVVSSSTVALLRPVRAQKGQRLARELLGEVSSPSTVTSIPVVPAITVIPAVGVHANRRAGATLASALTARGGGASITLTLGGCVVPFWWREGEMRVS